MEYNHRTPSDIERTSMSIIEEELHERKIILPEENKAAVKRVIHATADFDFAETMAFSENAVSLAKEAISKGAVIVTDTNMAKAGISKSALESFGGKAECFMADPEIAERAKAENTTRAAVSMEKAAKDFPLCIYAVGNAPTALFKLCELIKNGLRPALVIAVPVGFVNVVEAKKEIFETCIENNIPVIAAMGRKGGSTVAAAICNALIYEAADMLNPSNRGWN